jgi:hypothetical protein
LATPRSAARGWTQKPVRPTRLDQAEVADEFGQARHQADDARHAGKAPVLAAERIDQRLIPQPLLQEKG